MTLWLCTMTGAVNHVCPKESTFSTAFSLDPCVLGFLSHATLLVSKSKSDTKDVPALTKSFLFLKGRMWLDGTVALLTSAVWEKDVQEPSWCHCWAVWVS